MTTKARIVGWVGGVAIGLGVWGAGLAGCGAGAFHMRAARDAVTIGQPPEGRAQIVFFMPGRSREVAGLVDQRGTYYGQIRAETVLVRDVPPGRYRFYAIRERNGYAVDVPLLAAGQTAYIGGVDPLITSFVWRSMSGCDAEAIEARRSLSTLARMEPDPDVPLETILRELGDIPRRTGEADRDLDAMSGAHRALHTVDAESLARGGDCDAAATSGSETTTTSAGTSTGADTTDAASPGTDTGTSTGASADATGDAQTTTP
ncbi:MAG: hypothetical protein K1X94_32815 [Sandaracinaceae bacterium]|nr:hypothetical protein [Sandaracinaceae bacterium]